MVFEIIKTSTLQQGCENIHLYREQVGEWWGRRTGLVYYEEQSCTSNFAKVIFYFTDKDVIYYLIFTHAYF